MNSKNNKNFINALTETNKPTPLGPLPQEWEVVRLGEVMIPDREKIKAKEYSGKEKIVEKIPFDSGLIVFREKNKTATDLFKAGKNHLLISKINFHQGAVAITKEITVATTHYEFYKTSENSDLLYLWYYFRSDAFKDLFAEEIRFRGYKKEANFKFIKDFQIPLPPLHEQKKIAYVLSVIQEAEEQTQKYIDALKELKKSTMKHLFTYGAVAFEEIDKVELKETEIGWVPKHWGVVRVVDLFEITKKPKKTIKDNELIPFISMENISDSKETPTYTLKEFSKISSGIFVLKDDLIISKITPCFENGKQAILTNLPSDFGIATTEVIPLHPKDDRKVITKHLYNFLKIPEVREKLANKMEGTTGRKRLPKHALNHFLIPLPPPPEQQHIAEILSNIDKNIEVAENKKKAINKIFQSMLKNLMTAKIRVNNLEVKYDA
ncbi:MAG TPA: restriction endonuclease subunit S [Syntrophorhabdaceae bacterium]|nr:restriction endonuclease subunit S [Syntrophorhabdaceae bacterium]